jgi:V/A-type H+-transporting ATPase subunit I
MIVPMKKLFVAARAQQKDQLLDALRNLGMMHLIPVDAGQAVPDDALALQLDQLDNAEAVLQAVDLDETPPATDDLADLSGTDVATEVATIQRLAAESQSKLTGLFRQLTQIELWGDVRLEQLTALDQAGLHPRFFMMSPADAATLDAECVEVLAELGKDEVLVAVADRTGEFTLPEELDADELERPSRDAPTLRAEADAIDKTLHANGERLAMLAHRLGEVQIDLAKTQTRVDFQVAQRGGLTDDALFAVQGWVPADQAQSLHDDVAAVGVDCGVHQIEPAEDEDPPTLIRYPKWARPIKALFDILGTTPGYREFDLAPIFMIAMPIFSAMLIGDAGYGLLFVLLGLWKGKALTKSTGSKNLTNMILIFGCTTVLWGVLTANYFGVGPSNMPDGMATVAKTTGLLYFEDADGKQDAVACRNIVIQISFLLGVIHLVTAHLTQILALWPDRRALAETGWCSFLIGMFGVVWLMFSPDPIIPLPGIFGLLAAGATLIIWFSFPDKKLIPRIALGFIGNIMSMINTFGDTISYIRLMAVGLASFYIASAFNTLALGMTEDSWVGWIPAAIILVLAHAMNIGLCLIAIFAHAVRLNMLELSTNAGVQWAGAPYKPFAVTKA